VYSREIDDQVLTLSASGWVYIDTFILFDYETESMWFPFHEEGDLKCISGTYLGRNLPILKFSRMPWKDWLEQYPDSKFLVY